jgi:cytochrome c biogenesis factor
VSVAQGGRELGVLSPRMNQYERQREPVGTPAVRSALFEDLYLSAMNIDPASGSLGLMAMVNPMVGWIWAATALMALGSVVALVPVRPDPRR